MKKEELRIGNFIVSKMAGIINVQFIPVNIDMDNYEPIPLTEEWLRKFNAESYFSSDPQETQASKVFKFGDIKIHMCNEDVEEFMFESFEFIKIKTVHQLQNLYFNLTETELTYKNEF